MMLLLVAALVIPPGLFVLGCCVQGTAAGRVDGLWALPCAGALLIACGYCSRVSGLHPLAVYLPVLVLATAAGGWRMRRSGIGLPVGSMVIYSGFAWCSMLFLGSTDFISFGGDWVEHGFTIPMAFMTDTPADAIRPCMLCVVYGDLYTVLSQDCSRYYLVQILAAAFNAGIVFVFLDMIRGTGKRELLVASVLCCPFVIYEVAYIWPKFFAVSIAYAALRLLYAKDGTWRCVVGGVCAMVLAVLVHPLPLFVAVSAPFFMRDRIKLGGGFAIRMVTSVATCVLLPSLLMKSVGVHVTSTIAYYPFSDGWLQAFRAAKAGDPLIDYAGAYFRRVGVLGAIKSRVVTLVSIVAPVAGIGRFAFWQSLMFALGPVGFALGCMHMLRRFSSAGWREGLSDGLFAVGPVLLGVVFSTGYMVLQVVGGHWLIVVMAAYACMLLATVDEQLAKPALAISAVWNAMFVAIMACSIRVKSPDWAPGLTANLDSLARMLPGFSHETPVYFADLFDWRITIALYMLGGIATAMWILRTDVSDRRV